MPAHTGEHASPWHQPHRLTILNLYL